MNMFLNLSLRIFTVLSLMAFTHGVYGQSRFRINIKTGLNFSTLSKDVGPFDNNSTGYKKYIRISGMAGAGGTYSINKNTAVAVELLYNSRGGAYRQENNGVVVIGSQGAEKAYNYFKFAIDYVEMPLLVKYDLANANARTAFNIYGGVAPAIAVNERTVETGYSGNGNSPIANQVNSANKLNYVRGFNVFPQFGIEIGGKNRDKHSFFVDLRFSFSALPVFTEDEYSNGANMKTGTSSGGLAVGIRF